MPRAKVSPEPVLKDWSQVDDALREIGMIDRKVAFAEARLNERIDALKKRYDEDVADALARKARLEKDLQEFCSANRADFGKLKTRRLTFGEVSYRLIHKIKPLSKWTLAKVLEHLEALGARGEDYIRVKKSVVKDRLRDEALAGADVSEFGVRLDSKDEFGYKIEMQKLETAQ